MCIVVADQGLLKLGQSRDDKLKRVTLKVDEADVTFALQGIRFFRNCLHCRFNKHSTYSKNQMPVPKASFMANISFSFLTYLGKYINGTMPKTKETE
ncbi:hypothetical protein OIU84_008695 [Salix udensis]|uniref:Uncharacterized protein n=1 Tax=Salix udensis TaxID=889485 RepID=A0AAD6JQG9_9ROSI|nr:hypothetical protein OIU84_008695 [Salix udensis]